MEEGRRRKDTAPSLVAYLTEMIMEMTHEKEKALEYVTVDAYARMGTGDLVASEGVEKKNTPITTLTPTRTISYLHPAEPPQQDPSEPNTSKVDNYANDENG